MPTETTHATGPVSDVELAITGMTCASCANRIERKLNKLDGVEASVNYATEKAHVTFADTVSTDDLLFLHNEVRLAGEQLRLIDPGMVFGSMTCSEAEALADIFTAAGDQETHDHIINSHGHGDDDPEDQHHAWQRHLDTSAGLRSAVDAVAAERARHRAESRLREQVQTEGLDVVEADVLFGEAAGDHQLRTQAQVDAAREEGALVVDVTDGRRRVLDAPVRLPPHAGEGGACFPGLVADGDQPVE